MDLKIKEALEEFNANSEKKMTLVDLAREIWPDTKTQHQRMNISKLANGKRPFIKIEWVPLICRTLKCDANRLFNVKPVK